MEIVNLSAEPLGKLYSWIPHGLKAERIVFLPDACPGKSPLPTGTAVLTRQSDWRRYAVSDCGCGMRLLRSKLTPDEIKIEHWDRLADLMRANKGKLGDLGGGNHFLDAMSSATDGRVRFLIHTGSRNESGLVDAFVDAPARFDAEFDRVVVWARDNRAAIQHAVESVFGSTQVRARLATQHLRDTARRSGNHSQRFSSHRAGKRYGNPIPHVGGSGACPRHRNGYIKPVLVEPWHRP